MNDYIIKNRGYCTEISYKDQAKIKLYAIFPGIYFAFNEIHTVSLPIMSEDHNEWVYTINYAIRGNCGSYSVNDKYIYLRAGEIMFSGEQAAKSFEYPTGEYLGLEIYIKREAFVDQEPLKQFQIDLDHIGSLYLQEGEQTVIFENGEWLKNALADISNLYQHDIIDISLLKLHTLYLLRGLTAGLVSSRSGYEGALTKGQVDIAKKAKHLLVEDLLSKRTIADVAKEMGVSATSLKNYFKAIYGKNISDYRQEVRIERAKELLQTTDLSVGEITSVVGLESQSKLTALFHERVGITPTEFKRKNKR